MLLTLASCSDGGQYSEMRQRLDALNELNRSDSVLTITERDEAQTLTDYFDSHGTPNDQLLAHYLLGRCYADMREANTEIPEDANAFGLQEVIIKSLSLTESEVTQLRSTKTYHLALSIVRPFLTHLNF